MAACAGSSTATAGAASSLAASSSAGGWNRRDLDLELAHHLGQLAVAGREARGQPQLLERADQIGLAPVEIAERAPGRQVVGCRPRDDVQLALGLMVEPELHQAAPERDARGHVGGVEPEAGAARLDGFVEAAARRYSSASEAKAMDAGSASTRRFSSSRRVVSPMVRTSSNEPREGR